MSTAAKRLRDAGFDERQAEAAVSMVRDATGAEHEALATKADLHPALRIDIPRPAPDHPRQAPAAPRTTPP